MDKAFFTRAKRTTTKQENFLKCNCCSANQEIPCPLWTQQDSTLCSQQLVTGSYAEPADSNTQYSQSFATRSILIYFFLGLSHFLFPSASSIVMHAFVIFTLRAIYSDNLTLLVFIILIVFVKSCYYYIIPRKHPHIYCCKTNTHYSLFTYFIVHKHS